MRKTMTELSAEFNGTADPYLRGNVRAEVLLTKYDAGPALRRWDTRGKPRPCRFAPRALRVVAAHFADDKGAKADYYTFGKMDILFSRLFEPATVAPFPAAASEALAEASLDPHAPHRACKVAGR